MNNKSFPRHKCGLYLEHNPHKDLYEDLGQWIADHEIAEDDWVPGEYEKALAADEIWTLQWYPNTPVGFNYLAASTLEALLEAAD